MVEHFKNLKEKKIPMTSSVSLPSPFFSPPGHPATLLGISSSNISGSTLSFHVDLKKLTLTELDLVLNSIPFIYDPTSLVQVS